MSAADTTRPVRNRPRPARPPAITQVAAVLVLLALAALCAYTLFSGPTPIPSRSQPSATPVQAAPQQPFDEGGEGGRQGEGGSHD